MNGDNGSGGHAAGNAPSVRATACRAVLRSGSDRTGPRRMTHRTPARPFSRLSATGADRRILTLNDTEDDT